MHKDSHMGVRGQGGGMGREGGGGSWHKLGFTL